MNLKRVFKKGVKRDFSKGFIRGVIGAMGMLIFMGILSFEHKRGEGITGNRPNLSYSSRSLPLREMGSVDTFNL